MGFPKKELSNQRNHAKSERRLTLFYQLKVP